MAKVPTPHIGAREGEIADCVIMAGDPLRAKFMAEPRSVQCRARYAGLYGNI